MEFPTYQKDPRLRNILPFPTQALHYLKLHPMPQPSRSEKTPPVLTPYQPPWIYFKPRQIGQFPHINTQCEGRQSRSSIQSSCNPPSYGFTQTNWREMYMGTAQSLLQEGRGRQHRGLEQQQAERSAKKPLSTKPTAPPNLWCPWQVIRADQAKKSMGQKDRTSKWEIQFRLLLQLWVWFWLWART